MKKVTTTMASNESRGLVGTFRLILGLILLFFIILGLWYIGVPVELINKKVEDSFYNKGIRVEMEHLRKGIFYNVSIERMLCYEADRVREISPILVISDIEAQLDPLSLLRLKPAIKIKGSLQGGSIIGDFLTFENLLHVKIKDVQIEGLRFLNDLGIYGKGIVSGDLFFKDSRADLRLHISDAELKDITDSGFIPLSLFNSIRGYIEFSDGTMNIHSISLEGKGIYGRIQGSRFKIQDSGVINIGGSRLELMINSDVSMPDLIELALIRYKKSPGYYIIPLDQGIFGHK